MAARSKWHDDGNGALGPFGTRPVSHKPRCQNQNSKDARQGGRHFRKLICDCAQKRHWQTVCPLYPRKQTVFLLDLTESSPLASGIEVSAQVSGFSIDLGQAGGHVRFGSKADICSATRDVRFTPNSDRESEFPQEAMSALPPKADMCGATKDVRFGPIADISLTRSPRRRRSRGLAGW
jgi:hypothetical protein